MLRLTAILNIIIVLSIKYVAACQPSIYVSYWFVCMIYQIKSYLSITDLETCVRLKMSFVCSVQGVGRIVIPTVLRTWYLEMARKKIV